MPWKNNNKNRLGIKHSEATRKIISIKLTGRTLSEQHKKNISKSLIDNPCYKDKERGKKISLSKKGKKASENARKNMSIAKMGTKSHLGIKHSEATKNKISIKLTGRRLSQETKDKISKYQKLNNKFRGKHPSDKTKLKMSLAKKGITGRKLSEETKKKISDKSRGRKLSQETKNKIRNTTNRPEYKMLCRINRAKQVFPIKDTLIEIKIQELLKGLNIEFYKHKLIRRIKNSYQCDVFIPKQQGILQDTIIECDGDFIHCNPQKYSADYIRFPNSKDKITAKMIWDLDKARTQELEAQGYRVIRLWGNEINYMDLNKFKEILIEENK